MIAFRLYFGRSIPDGGRVGNPEFNDFLSYSVDIRFPGYTVYHAEGVWNGEPEDTTILEIIAESKRSDEVRCIAQVYKDRFDQVSVLITQHHVEVEFI